MAYDKHPCFTEPPNPKVRIWRYLDFTKFVSLLETKALYFTRADLFPDDPFEGSVTAVNIVARKAMEEDLKAKHGQQAGVGLSALFSRGTIKNRQSMFLNCWHMNDYESAAMWKLYARSNEAVAIESTFTRLRGVLPGVSKVWPCAYVGVVKYIDYEKEYIPDGNAFWPFVHKRRSFAHEQELRAIVSDMKHWTTPGAEPPRGHLIPVNLDVLIANIWVAPTAEEWFSKLVDRVCERYGLKKNVHQSSLDKDPLF